MEMMAALGQLQKLKAAKKNLKSAQILQAVLQKGRHALEVQLKVIRQCAVEISMMEFKKESSS